jgi:hypothetical protein
VRTWLLARKLPPHYEKLQTTMTPRRRSWRGFAGQKAVEPPRNRLCATTVQSILDERGLARSLSARRCLFFGSQSPCLNSRDWRLAAQRNLAKSRQKLLGPAARRVRARVPIGLWPRRLAVQVSAFEEAADDLVPLAGAAPAARSDRPSTRSEGTVWPRNMILLRPALQIS